MSNSTPERPDNAESEQDARSSTSEVEPTESQLKAAKAKAKANFTRNRHRLLKLLDDREIDLRTEIRAQQDKLMEAEAQALEEMERLLEFYVQKNDSSKEQQIQMEVETLESEFSAAMSKAESSMENPSEADTHQSESSVHSSPSDIGVTSAAFATSSMVTMPVTSASGLPLTASTVSLPIVSSTEFTPAGSGIRSALPTAGTFSSFVRFVPPPTVTYSYGNGLFNSGTFGPQMQQNIYPPVAPTNNSVGQDLWRQLRKVSIPIFSGDKRNYEAWKAAFMACVDKAPMSAEYKLLQLRQYLSGDALKAIENLGHSEASYEAAKERLERKFGGARRHIALQLDAVENFRPMRAGNAVDLEKFADLLDLTVINLSESGRSDELGCGSLYHKLIKKMDENMNASFQRWLYEQRKLENVENLRQFVLQEAEFRVIATESVHGVSKSEVGSQRRKPGMQLSYFGQSNEVAATRCECCNGQHQIWKCESFSKRNITDRWQLAKDKHLCFRCLGSSHSGSTCRRSRPCGLNGCNRVHHRLLHDNNKTSQISRTVPKTIESSSPVSSSYPPVSDHQSTAGRSLGARGGDTNGENLEKVLMTSTEPWGNNFIALRTVPVILKNGSKSVQINALLDDGSTKTYLNADVAAELGLVGELRHVTVNVINGQRAGFRTQVVDVELQSLNGSVNVMISAFTTDKVTGDMKAVDWKKYQHKWPHLGQVRFPKIQSHSSVDMLIGLDYADLHFAQQEVRGGPGEPIARLTPLGWTCVGMPSPGKGELQTNFAYTYLIHDEADLGLALRKFWEIEEVTTPEYNMSTIDKQLMQQASETMTYANGKYSVRIPWKDGLPKLPSNYGMAVKRLENTERRLQKDSTVRDAYCQVISQYIEKGYIQKIDSAEAKEHSWFLPHFPIVRLDKATTKTRIVFDASAVHHGMSLNQLIHQGPKLQRDLSDVLLRFRKNPVALVCDIAEMYLQIEINPVDRMYFRFLWRDVDINRTPDVYEFSRVVFGANCSPFLAQFVAQQHARKFASQFPLAAETLLKSTYMDDSMDSTEDSHQGMELYKQLSQLWKLAGMHTRKWLSNCDTVLACIPSEDRATEMEIEGDLIPGTKTLGVLWWAMEDVFTFRYKSPDEMFVYTKRSVLKKVAALFDPLGFLAPFVIRAKILLQKMWISGLDWDDELDPELKSEVKNWFMGFGEISEIRVPRCLRLNISEKLISLSLHVFTDASSEAYGAVVYARCVYDNELISCRLVCAKTRVAPLTSISIPRLELMAAVLGVRLGTSTADALGLQVSELTFWTDSMNVLCWIRNHSRSYKPFVANRVGEIQSSTNSSQWRYVSTKENPADLASRGCTVSRFTHLGLWWNGSEFLSKSESSWPAQPAEHIASNGTVEMRSSWKAASHTTMLTCNYIAVKLHDRLDPIRYSDWNRLIRVQSWVLRFANNSRLLTHDRATSELNQVELKEAEILLLKACQQEAFGDEYIALLQQRPLPNHSKLLTLNPQLDEDGLIRSNGRLVNATMLPYDTRYPIILPKKHSVTTLIVKFEHEKGAHVCGVNHILSELSKKYWILSGREVIREWQRNCMECRRRTAKTATQIMAPLPSSRLKPPETLRAFSHTALDFAGPFITIRGRGKCREKRYLCLFTCMSTRAVHLEMAYGLDTDSFINALYRFANRRGWPNEMTSDNGSNFVGAARELNELVSQLKRETIVKSTAVHAVKWNFNPPAAPHFGGVYEIMIKAAKRAVYAILGNADVTDEELSSAFIGAEALLNSRPLTYQSSNPQDITPLTPSHFLHGELGRQAAPVPGPEENLNHIRRRWRRVQELIRHFWQRWIREWIPGLNSRKKWNSTKRNFAVGDIVIVMSAETARGKWPLGRIVEVMPGKDGHVRVVKVQVGKTVFTRAINYLCPLEIVDD